MYFWADGIHVNVRLEDDANRRQCMLVLMGATAEGQKELIAVADGYRESEQIVEGVAAGREGPRLGRSDALATGDGALGFWEALPQGLRRSA